jgi:hypothetical protein
MCIRWRSIKGLGGYRADGDAEGISIFVAFMSTVDYSVSRNQQRKRPQFAFYDAGDKVRVICLLCLFLQVWRGFVGRKLRHWLLIVRCESSVEYRLSLGHASKPHVNIGEPV